MNKADFIKVVAHKCGSSERRAAVFVNGIFGAGDDPGVLAECLAQEGTVSLGRFGIFKTRLAPSYTRIHPRTKVEVIVSSTLKVCFRAGAALRRALNPAGPSSLNHQKE